MAVYTWIGPSVASAFGDLQVQSYNLYDPSNNKEYFIGHKFAKLPDETAFGPVRFRVYASKHGWVFLAATSEITGNRHLFLCHAFNRKTIDLPVIKTTTGARDPGNGTFSTIPTCSNCVFYVVDTSYDAVTVSTYRNGDAEWCMYKFANLENKMVKDALYWNGLFYCLCSSGLLWAFDIVCGDWRQIPIDASHIISLGTSKMVESDGVR
ncbi:F-box/kelch-repeat protein [Tripterygium wilfordii]|uniref:F-box/kelch-repeat protein n=1 Tax=Tripterygium wilfordii TaxID=458696 RepID=A0A7J7BUF9_TRIWF|nr:F-box protein At3g56470-like isoform X1 [Tripterygium wilfordii]KAF5725543.1 F-box/kelch-repeat protein [Tripterygium wilfordii]